MPMPTLRRTGQRRVPFRSAFFGVGAPSRRHGLPGRARGAGFEAPSSAGSLRKDQLRNDTSEAVAVVQKIAVGGIGVRAVLPEFLR